MVRNAVLLEILSWMDTDPKIHLSDILPFLAPFEIGGIAHVAFQNR